MQNIIMTALFVLFFWCSVNAEFYESPTFPECFGVECRNNGMLDMKSCTCQCSFGYTGHECEHASVNSVWPGDNFALPETVFGCPEENIIGWRKISVHLIVNNTLNRTGEQAWPALPHYLGPFQNQSIQLNFCFKTRTNSSKIQWPDGKYCVYKEHPCMGIEEKFLTLKGYQVQSSNVAVGTIDFMQEAYSNGSISVRFMLCCVDQEAEITALPNTKPFMLINPSSDESCQQVDGAEVRQEWFAFNEPLADNTTEGVADHISSNNTDNISPGNVSYCFYKPYRRRECKYKSDEGASYRGRANKTMHGLPCLPWTSVPAFGQSNILEENYCRAAAVKQRLSCVVWIKEKKRRLNCHVDYCRDEEGEMDDILNKFRNIALFRPVSSNVIKAKHLRYIVNGLAWIDSPDEKELSVEGSNHPDVSIHLGSRFLIHSVMLYRNTENCDYPFKWTNVAVWVHTFKGQYQSFGAHLCWEIEDLMEVCNIEMRCVQPVSGYYVTVQANINALGEDIQLAATVVNFEEIQVFGEETQCGQVFNIWDDGISTYQLFASNGLGLEMFKFRNIQGCFKQELNITIDLLVPMTIEGIAVAAQTPSVMKLFVKNGNKIPTNEDSEEFMVVTTESESIQHKYFKASIFTRRIVLSFVTDTNSEVCVAFDLIGCPKMVVKDPQCTKNESMVGMSMETNSEIIVNVDLPDFVTTTIGTNDTGCMDACMNTDQCLTWNFSHDNGTCSLIPLSLYRNDHIKAVQRSTTNTEQELFRNTTSSGEKICFKEVKNKYPCRYELTLDNDPLYISSRNYPGPYQRDIHCTWIITDSSHEEMSVKVTFLDLDLVPPRNLFRVPFFHDVCADFVSLNGQERTSYEGPHLVISYENATAFLGASTFMEQSKAIYINLVTCQRKRVYSDNPRGFLIKIERSDCSGCKNKFSTCHVNSKDARGIEKTTCSDAKCGYLSSKNYLGQNEPDIPYYFTAILEISSERMTCSWIIYTVTALQIEFLHFDIPGKSDCKKNGLVLYGAKQYLYEDMETDDFGSLESWYQMYTFCNSRKPLKILYISTAVGVEYSASSGTGFLLKWKHVLPDGKDKPVSLQKVTKGTIEYCHKQFDLFVEYPYKCYYIDSRHIQRNRLMTWYTAQKSCEEHDAKLVEITNTLEEELIFQAMREHKVNNAFIGFQRNYTSGLLYDANNNHATYIKWGFDEQSQSMEPNGVEEDTCIMLRHVLNLTADSMGYKWADVNCYDTYTAVIICEHEPVQQYVVEDKSTSIIIPTLNDTFRSNERLFECDSGEYILSMFRCDQRMDCLDKSDEEYCEYGNCDGDLFACGDTNQKCIHVNLTCDFYPDCDNAADEVDCVHVPCNENSWQCNNGQCIPVNERFDKKYDCIDKSDEIIGGSTWTLGFETYNVLEAGTTSNVYLKIYSKSGISQEVFLDRHSTEFPEGATTTIEKIIDVKEPFKIRVKVDRSGLRPFWYLKKVTMVEEDSGLVYTFQCDCNIPASSTTWITYKDISITDPITLGPQFESTIYTITVITGRRRYSNTKNQIYITVYGNTSDSGLFELRDQKGDAKNLNFKTGSTGIFEIETPHLGELVMIEVFHFGQYIYDEWFLHEIYVHDSFLNETVQFNHTSWVRVNIKDKDIGIRLFNESRSVIVPSYVKESSCPDHMFACIDGQCIPKVFYCDQVVHCHGPFHEDEPLVCAYRHIGESCAHLLSYDDAKEGFYDITFEDDTRPYEVHCVFGEDRHFVITRVHHDLEYWESFIEESSERIEYVISSDGIAQLKQNSEFCQQTIDVGCYHTYTGDISEDDIVILLNDGINRPLFSSWRNVSCDGSQSCQCLRAHVDWYSRNRNELYLDEVILKDARQIPIVGIELKKRFTSPSQLQMNIGTLDCYQRAIRYQDSKKPCRNGGLYEGEYTCILEYDSYMMPLGCRDMSHLDGCKLYQCSAGYVKCPSSYCIPLHYLCNGVKDCMDGYDEHSCNDLECKGTLRCRQSGYCVHDRHICDGRLDCPLGDDEMLCNSTGTKIRTLSPKTFRNLTNYPYLAYLDMSRVKLSIINQTLFSGLYNLLSLDLSDNRLKELTPDIFTDLDQLKKLKLNGNTQLQTIHPGAFRGLKFVGGEMDLSNMKISTVFSGTFEGLKSLKVLNLSHNEISDLQNYGFSGMGDLEKLYLNGNPITEFSNKIFDGLTSLKVLVSDLFLLCCIRPSTVAEDQCFPKRDEFSSCDDLMRNEMLRYFVWIIGMFALFGNALALVYRMFVESLTFRTGNGILLTNLCIADFLMGLYMLIIGSADTYFRGEYVWNDISWRRGKLCKFAGFLSFVSSEASGAFLCLMTIDRWVTIKYTLRRAGFTKTSALQTCIVLWAVCIFLALLPLFGLGYFDEDFYTKSGVCLALPLTTDRRGGWEYAVAIFVFLNFAMFVFIALGQALIFREILRARMDIGGKQKRDNVAIARKLFLMVMTNFLCWFPICILGLMAMVGFVIDSEVYAWVAVFVLPFNSATNPILYTLSSIFTGDLGLKIKKKLAITENANHPSEKEEAFKLNKLFECGLIRLNYEPNIISLTQYMENHRLTLAENVRISKVLATALDLLHTLGYVAGPFSTDEVLIRLNQDQCIRHVSLMSIPLYSDTVDDISSDIANLGLVMKKMMYLPKRLTKRASNRKLVP